MEAVPKEIIEEILARLPVKSLLRFKCVCRRWCALIQSRRFIHHHYSNEQSLVFRLGESVEYYLGKILSQHLGAVNGVLCEVSASGDIVLLNPATHKVKRVPGRFPVYELTLGFGLDPLSGDYKIVAIVDGADEFVWVYNSSSDCWKVVEVVGSHSLIKAVRYSRSMKAVFSNGVYYWRVLVLDGGVHHDILAFDMTSEKFREIKAPRGLCVNTLVAYGDSIALMSSWSNGYELWAMGKQGVWSKSLTLKDSCRLWPLCLWKNKVLFWNVEEHPEYSLVDVSTGEVRRVEVEPPNHPMQFPCFSYKESLFWIKE